MESIKIKAFMKRTDRPDGYMTNVSNALKNLQNIVGGYIETITIHGLGKDEDKTAVVICNEEGRLLGLPENGSVMGIPIVGDYLIVGQDGEEFADVPLTIKEIKAIVE